MSDAAKDAEGSGEPDMTDGDRTYRPGWLRAMPFLGRPPALTRRQWRVLGLVAAASFFEQYDLYLFALALKQIQVDLAVPEAQLGFLGSLIRFGALPAFVMTLVADRIGRRQVLLFTILAYTLLTGATAFAPDVQTFVILQLLTRTFAVAETLLAVVVIAEEFDPAVRGWGIGALGAIQSGGAGLAALLFAGVEHAPFGWRSLYLVGLGPLLVLAYLRRNLPETVRFAAHRQQRAAGPQTRHVLRPLADLMRMYPGRLVAVASVVFVLALAESPASFFGPKYLQEAHGWSPTAVGLMTFWGGAFAIVGNTFAGWLSDRWGRRRVTSLFLVGQVTLTITYYNAFGPFLVPIWIGMLFVILGANVTLAAFGAELFPTSYRSTAAGARVVVAALGASLGLSLEAILYGVLGSHWVAICWLAGLALIGVLIVIGIFPETAGQRLEDIAPERS